MKLPEELRAPKIFNKDKVKKLSSEESSGQLIPRRNSDAPPRKNFSMGSSSEIMDRSSGGDMSDGSPKNFFLGNLSSKFNLTDIFITHRSLAQSIGRLFIAILNLKDLLCETKGYYNVKTYIENSQNNKYNQFLTKPSKGTKYQNIKMMSWNDEFNFMVESEEDILKIVVEKLYRKNIFSSNKNEMQSSQQKSLYKGKKPKTIKTFEIKIKELIKGELKNLSFDIIDEKYKLQLDVKLQFLPQEQEKKFQDLEELVVSDLCYLDAFYSCCSLLEIDATANALVNVFQWHDKSTPLLEWAIKKEVEKINSAPLLFREQSLAVKIFSLSVFYHGKDYVKQMLNNFIRDLDKEAPLEINPGTIESSEVLIENRERLKKYATTLMTKIWNSAGLLPTIFKQIGIMLKKIVGEKFPNDVYSTFSGFFFLRFLIPSLVAPTNWDIVEEVKSTHTKRTLMLIGKLITSMANRIHFGEKEMFMIPLNDWIDEHDKMLTEFFESIVEDPNVENKINNLNIRKRSIYNDLHSFVHRNLNSILKSLQQPFSSTIKKTINELGVPEAEIEKVETIGIIGLMNINHKLGDHFANQKKVTGKEISAYLKDNSPICEGSRVNAMLLAERMVEMELLTHCKESSLPFTDDDECFVFGPSADYCLNSFRKWTPLSRNPVEVSVDLLKGISLLYLRACSMTGTILTSSISLASISQYPDYKLFSIATEELQKTKTSDLPSQHKLVFWLNVFNLLAMHSHIFLSNNKKVEFLSSTNNNSSIGSSDVKYLTHFFTKTSYMIDGFKFSLADILFGVFRRNSKLPPFKPPFKKIFSKWTQWKETDPRMLFILDEEVPLSFFALCMSFSDSPSLQIFHPDNFLKQFNEMIVNYLSNNIIVNSKNNSIKIPSLVSLFECDFLDENNKDLFSFLKEISQKFQIKTLLSLFDTLDPKHKFVTEIVPFDFSFCCDLNFVEQDLQL